MSIFRKQRIVFLVVFNLAAGSFYGQGIEKVIAFADMQYQQKNYSLAAKEYRRALFFSEGIKNYDLYSRMGHCYFELSNYDTAATYFDNAYFLAPSDSLKYEAVFQKASCCLLKKNFQFALIDLLSLNDSLPAYFTRKKNFYLGITYFGLGEFKFAGEHFINCVDPGDSIARAQIENLFDKRKNLYRPHPQLAMVLSIFVPGLGQLYAGDIKNGINSLVLVGGLGLVTANTALQYSIFDAAIGVFPWFERYYQGGFTQAKKIAEKKRARRREKTYHEILTIVGESAGHSQ